jgi:hypothetical protein
MRKEYDFSEAKRNPYAARARRRVTIRLDAPTIQYFGDLAEETRIPHQTLMSLYLRECAASRRKPSLHWCRAG